MNNELMPELPPLPLCWDYVYLWDGPYGARKFTTAPHNGRNCDSSQMVYTADQMHAYARAAIEAATEQGKRQPTEGYPLGPIEATPAMYVKGGEVLMNQIRSIESRGRKIDSSNEAIARSIFTAMCEAAP